MNNPEYIVTEVIGEIVEATRISLGFPVLNYQFGYIEELNETLAQYNTNPNFSGLKFPLVWLPNSFTIVHKSNAGNFGTVEGLALFIINSSTINWKAKDRRENNFKPIIWPIRREIINQVNLHSAVVSSFDREYRYTDFYYFGEDGKSVLNDVVDCTRLTDIEFYLQNNLNCIPHFKNF